MRVPFDCSAALPDNCRDKFAKRVFNAVRASDVAALRRALAPLLDEKINRDMATCALYESLGFTTVGAAAESLGQPIEFVKERVISGDLEHVMQDNGRGWISTESLARVAASQVAAPAAASSTRNSDHTSDKSPE
ncbi:hypothetical protein [Methylocapsa acidiphila]|uniref:hypothetical protein n=1 Tax=Methylocapsa acidiphila TaxID=133552 RepID=UPI0012EBD6B0|nr:hypothetical protein [Methylocapsa acidiphila]